MFNLRAGAPALERLEVCARQFVTRERKRLDLPPLHNLRVLNLVQHRSEVKLFTALQAQRLRWVFLRFPDLSDVVVNCPELAWLGVSEPVHVFSHCSCPLMGCGEAELPLDGELRQRHDQLRSSQLFTAT